MQALVRRGAAVTLVAWDDVGRLVCGEEEPEEGDLCDITDTLADVVVLRTTWDYWDRIEAFRGFMDALVPFGFLQNGAATVLANMDKRYLRELEGRGVGIVPTLFVERGGEVAAVEEARGRGWSTVVVKPHVGAAGSGLEKFDRLDQAAGYLEQVTREGVALVQKFLPRVVSEGETSLVYFDGVFSHAVTKVPAVGDFRSQVDFGGVYTLARPDEAQLRASELALAAWEDRYGERPLYARVDLVPGDDGRPLLGELELIEPELFLDMDAGAADRFAGAIMDRVGPLGYGEMRLGERLWSIGCVAVLVLGVLCGAVGAVTIVGWVFGGP